MMRNKRYGIVLIGTGATSRRHLEAVRTLGHRLVGVVDLIPEKARKAKEEFGAETWSTDYRSLLQKKDVEIVIITTWPSSHARIAMDCFKAGKDVLCEKPMADTLKKAEEIIKAVKKTDRKIIFGYILRYNKSYQKIRQMIQTGKIGGPPIIIRMSGAEHVITDAHWEQDQALLRDTSPLIDCGCHYVDIMRWFTGEEVKSVSGIGARVEKETPKDNYDWGKLLARLTKGSVGSYEVGWGHNFRSHSEKEFIGPKGRIRLIYAGERPEHHEEGDLIEYYTYPGHYRVINVRGELKPTAAQLQDLIDHIENNKNCLPKLTDAYKSLQIVLAADQSIRTGKTCILGEKK